jgi:hypothetical protein
MNAQAHAPSWRVATQVVAALAAVTLLWFAWRAIPLPTGARTKWGMELIFGYTKGLVPLTASLTFFWYAIAAGRPLERRRMHLALKSAVVLVASALAGLFVVYTILAVVGGSNLGPIVGVFMAGVFAPAALFVGMLAGFAYSRYRLRQS